MDTSYTAPRSRIAALILAVLSFTVLLVAALTDKASHALELHGNPYAVPSGITLLVCVGLLGYFLSRPARTDERIWLAVYLGGLSFYTFGEMMQRLSATPQAALFWLHVRDPATVIAPALFLFTLAYVSRSERRYSGTTMVLMITALISAVLYVLSPTIYMNTAASMLPHPWGFTPTLVNAGVLSSLLIIDGLLVVSLVMLIRFRRHTRNDVFRKQSLIFIFALSINIIIPTFTDAVLPAAGVPIPPLGVTLSTITGAIIIYGLLRYQLLTVNPTLFSNTILGIMQESVVVTDGAFNIIYTNPEAEALLGIKANQHASKHSSLLSMIAAPSQADFTTAFKVPVEANETIRIKHIDLTRAHAAPVPVRVTSSRFQAGGFETRVMVLTDISDELHTQSIIEHQVAVRTEELHRARAYLISSINSLEQGFLLVDRRSQVELVNGRATKLFSIPHADDSTGMKLEAITRGAEWSGKLVKAVTGVLDAKHSKRLDIADSSGSFYQIYITPILSGQRELGAAIIIEDVTEQKIMDRSKDEFFSIASHELRTPLTAIRGNMSMIRDYFPEALKKEQGLGDMVTDTHDASVRLIEIVNDFLDSSRLEQGKMQFTLEPVEIAPIVTNVESDLGMLLERQKDKIIVDPSLMKAPKIVADTARVRQILYNLLNNAVKYSSEASITISAEAGKGKVKIRIVDTGKGISPENQKLLFHKFQQASDPLTRDDTKGTGLGLYIARLLAKNMHGDVQLEHSEEGKGSTFVITLPTA